MKISRYAKMPREHWISLPDLPDITCEGSETPVLQAESSRCCAYGKVVSDEIRAYEAGKQECIAVSVRSFVTIEDTIDICEILDMNHLQKDIRRVHFTVNYMKMRQRSRVNEVEDGRGEAR